MSVWRDSEGETAVDLQQQHDKRMIPYSQSIHRLVMITTHYKVLASFSKHHAYHTPTSIHIHTHTHAHA